MEGYQFTMEMAVRDYECDMQGIVNNSVYQNYLEHVRHEFLRHKGIVFKEYTRRGINLVVVRLELDFKYSLSSGDKFIVGLNLERESRIRFAFHQDIYLLPGNISVLKGKIIGTAISTEGRPYMPQEIERILGSV